MYVYVSHVHNIVAKTTGISALMRETGANAQIRLRAQWMGGQQANVSDLFPCQRHLSDSSKNVLARWEHVRLADMRLKHAGELHLCMINLWHFNPSL